MVSSGARKWAARRSVAFWVTTAGVSAGFFAAAVALYLLGECVQQDFSSVYRQSMRGSMFAAFVTMCSFLMSAKSFIVFNLKKELFDRQEYRDRHDLSDDRGLTVYGPLRNLSAWLIANIYVSLVTAVSQFTVGFVNHWLAPLFCVTAAVCTLTILARSLYAIQANLKIMFELPPKP